MPPGSDSKLESLRKILEQEETSSFPDTTVIGGLDRFLTRWADELKPAVEGLNSYSVLTPPQRAEWAGRAREKMASTGPAADTRTPATRSRQVRRAAKPRPTALALDDDVTRLKGISTWIWVYTVLRGQSNHCGLDVAAVGWRRERQFQVCLFQYHVYLPLVWSFVRGFLVIIVPRVWHLRCGGGDHGSLAALKLLADPMRRRRPALSPRR